MDNIVIGKDALIKKFRSLGESVQGMALARAAQAGSLPILNGARDNIKAKGLIRTRTLSRSLHTEVSMLEPTVAEAETGTNAEWAAIHEFGGVIHAKNSKYLAIPVGSYKDSPRNHPKLKLRKTAGGTLVLVSPGGQVQYVLKQSVEIPAEPYLRPAHDEHKQEAIDETGRAFKKLIEKAAME
jgi:phage gpG-like protein